MRSARVLLMLALLSMGALQLTLTPRIPPASSIWGTSVSLSPISGELCTSTSISLA